MADSKVFIKEISKLTIDDTDYKMVQKMKKDKTMQFVPFNEMMNEAT